MQLNVINSPPSANGRETTFFLLFGITKEATEESGMEASDNDTAVTFLFFSYRLSYNCFNAEWTIIKHYSNRDGQEIIYKSQCLAHITALRCSREKVGCSSRCRVSITDDGTMGVGADK